jgi:hypothetical protein
LQAPPLRVSLGNGRTLGSYGKVTGVIEEEEVSRLQGFKGAGLHRLRVLLETFETLKL